MVILQYIAFFPSLLPTGLSAAVVFNLCLGFLRSVPGIPPWEDLPSTFQQRIIRCSHRAKVRANTEWTAHTRTLPIILCTRIQSEKGSQQLAQISPTWRPPNVLNYNFPLAPASTDMEDRAGGVVHNNIWKAPNLPRLSSKVWKLLVHRTHHHHPSLHQDLIRSDYLSSGMNGCGTACTSYGFHLTFFNLLKQAPVLALPPRSGCRSAFFAMLQDTTLTPTQSTRQSVSRHKWFSM